MKKVRSLLLIGIAICIIGIILGSFFDLNISSAIANKDNLLGLIVSAIGLTFGYAIYPFLGGNLHCLVKRIKLNKPVTIIFFIASFLMYFCGTFVAGNMIFSVNAFYKEGIFYQYIIGFLIYMIPYAFVHYLGYTFAKKVENPNKMFNFVVIVTIATLIALIPVLQIFKLTFHRPRFRAIESIYGLHFYKWWEPCKIYNNFIGGSITKEEFKSLPSGHAATSMCFVIITTMLPLYFPKLKKYTVLLFLVGFIYSVFVSFTRILVAAHFLSDVSIGCLITLVFYYLAVLIGCKTKQVEE